MSGEQSLSARRSFSNQYMFGILESVHTGKGEHITGDRTSGLQKHPTQQIPAAGATVRGYQEKISISLLFFSPKQRVNNCGTIKGEDPYKRSTFTADKWRHEISLWHPAVKSQLPGAFPKFLWKVTSPRSRGEVVPFDWVSQWLIPDPK